MKRRFALAVTVAMLMNFSVAATAQEESLSQKNGMAQFSYSDVAGASYEETVKKISETGIMTGYGDGTFRPELKITRAEFLAVAARLLSVDHYARALAPKQNFSDVGEKHWASREIQYFYNEDMISGCGDGRFMPEDFVTYNAALKIVIEGLGYGEAAYRKGGWTEGYVLLSKELGIEMDDIADKNAPLTRWQTAMFCDKVLYAKASDGTRPIDKIGEDIFYVSPNGDDNNPGTKDKPWKSMRKAAQTLKAGETALFADGTYNETAVTTFANSGEEGKPVTVRSENKHGAVIKYSKLFADQTKMRVIDGIDYVTIQDFAFTQEVKSTSNTQDIFVRSDADYTQIIGNKFYNVYEEGIKLYDSHYTVIDGNTIIEPNHEGMDIFNCNGVIMRNNTVLNAGRTGFMVKGNARNCQIYNNYVYQDSVVMMSGGSAIGVGGSSDNYSPNWIEEGIGFENYYSAVYNNVVHCKSPGAITSGIAFISAKCGRVFNNIVIGCENGITTTATNGTTNGWEWDPPVIDPMIKNNIIVDCTKGINFSTHTTGNADVENNIFYGCVSGKSVGGRVCNPMLVDIDGGNYHLMQGSPAIDKGTAIPGEYEGFDGEIVKIEMIDYGHNPRSGKWDIGIYSEGE